MDFVFAVNSLKPRDFNSYGSRRGNDDVMCRGTFANIRLMNKFIGKAAPKTVHIPTKEVVRVTLQQLLFNKRLQICSL